MHGQQSSSTPDRDRVRVDPWRLDEWNALPDVCYIYGCEASETDPRGPVWLRDESMHKACREHWEGVYRVLGEQAGSDDAYRQCVPMRSEL